MTGDENNRHVNVLNGKLFLKLKTIQTWQRKVKNQATRDQSSWAAQKLLCGRECFWRSILITDQRFQRFADGNIVVDNEHGGSGG